MNLNSELLDWARSYTGLAEVEGDASNAIILEMARILAVPHYTADSHDWCGLFMAFLAHVTGAEKPSSFLLARNWLSVGAPVLRPRAGDVCVLWRGAIDGPNGHVGLWTGEDETNVWLLGGNQVNTVREFYYPRANVLGYRRLWRSR